MQAQPVVSLFFFLFDTLAKLSEIRKTAQLNLTAPGTPAAMA